MLENHPLDTDSDLRKHQHTSGLVPNNKSSYIRFPSKARLHFQPIWDLERDVVVVVLVPGMLNKLRCAHPLLGLLDQQLGDEVLGVLRDVSLITGGED